MKKRMGVLPDFEFERAHQICSFMWADNFWVVAHPIENLEQMLRDLIEEAEKWDLVPKPTSLWWTSSYEVKFKILGSAMNLQGKSHDAIEERMQSANKAFWKDILIYKSKDVPWKVKCQRLVDHVYVAFTYRSENWSWTMQTLDRIKGWETKTMLRLFRFKRHKA